MSAEENQAISRRFFDEVCNGRKLDVADEIIAAGHAYHDPFIPGVPPGPEGIKQTVSAYHSAFPDAHWAVEEQIAAEDSVVTRWIGSGTHRADLAGIAPTGRQVKVSGIWIQRVRDGKIVESWNNWDNLGLLQQLGVVSMQQPTAGDQDNVHIVQEIYANFLRGDVGAVLDVLADDVEWFIPGPAEIPYAGPRRGRQAVAEFFSVLVEAVEFEQFEPRQYVAQGDTVVAIGQDRRRAKSTGRVIEMAWAMVWKLRDGKVTGFRSYEDSFDAAAAFRGA